MRTTFLFVLMLSIGLACSREPSNEVTDFDEGPPVAVVNTDTISTEFYTQAFIQHLLNSGKTDSKENRYSFLTQLINDVLLSQRVQDFELTDEQYKDYRQQVRRISIADRLYSTAFLDTLSAPTDKQIESAFFNTKINMYVSHLFFTEKEKADRAYHRLEEGESFIDLANEIYNTASYDSSAGYIGEIRYFNVDHAFGEAAYKLKAGEYSKPVRTRLGYHIIYVNERVGNPLITEAEFNYKRDGITKRTKDRIMNLKGDAFVRTYMQSLNVKVDKDAVKKLFNVLKDLKPVASDPSGITQSIGQYPTDSEVEFVRNELEPGTVLASYEHLGETRYLLADDYFKWFRTLPKEEARNETMASVGRALRNQAFYEAGIASGLEDDAFVDFNVNYKMKLYGAYRVKKYLAEQPVDSIPVSEQKKAYEAFNINTIQHQSFSGWVITANDFDHACSIKDRIENGELPGNFESYKSYREETVNDSDDLAYQLFKVPLNTPSVVGTSDNFYVINVEDRKKVMSTFDDVQDQLISRMEKTYNLFNELKSLREKAAISIDTLAFEKLMDHYNNPGLQPSKVRQ